MEITDELRFKTLNELGYLPSKLPVFITPKDAVDWAIANKHVPAYWRQPENGWEVEANIPPYGNGLVYVKAGDRARIDQLIQKYGKLSN